MKIDCTVVLKDMDGIVINETKTVDGKPVKSPLTLDKACVNAILSEVEGERAQGTQKLERYLLAKKIYGASEVELTAEEITLIKDRVGKIYLPVISGQVWELLEGKSNVGTDPS